MRTTTPSPFLVLAALALAPVPGVAQDSYANAVEDSLEARVWLDRGAEPVVERGDEVRVYYRTSHDAYAAIFRIDTDGRIALVYPQHPDADPYVVGGRDYRLVFPEGARWRVREDPGVGYFFMVASYQPLDFSLFGYDDDRGWDLRGVGETVYQDPYVAIDDYVAAVLPDWERAGYALDFLEYSVDEEHDYPRFLCYDCHDYRPYAAWDPYARACSSFQVVIWDDPYFYPRFRYAGTRVVFARPIRPRPRYSVTARLVGSGPRPIVRSRAAPPVRTAVYKEVPRRGAATAAPSRRGVEPSRPGAARSSGRAVGPARPSASSDRSGASVRRSPPLPSARRGIAPTVRGTPAAGSMSPERDRPTLQRRAPRGPDQARPAGSPSSSGRATPTRSPRSQPRATPTRTPRSRPRATPTRSPRSQPRATPTRTPRSQPRATPTRTPRSQPRATPTRTPRSQPRATPTRTPRSQPRATPTRTPRSQPRATPTRTPGGQPRATPAPSRPSRSNVRPTPSRRPPSTTRSGPTGSRTSAPAKPRRRPGG